MAQEAPVKDHRYKYGDLIKVVRTHFIWIDSQDDAQKEQEYSKERVEAGEILIFIQAYGYKYFGSNWKRPEWNLLVISPKLGKIWVCDEHTESIDQTL